jgi:hypothetical protein
VGFHEPLFARPSVRFVLIAMIVAQVATEVCEVNQCFSDGLRQRVYLEVRDKTD